MKKLTAFVLALLMVFSFCSCTKNAKDSEANNSSAANSADEIKLDSKKAFKTAEKLIKIYENYGYMGVGCKLEKVTGEEEQAAWSALTDDQKDFFCLSSTSKCNCCKSYEEAIAHTKEYLDDSVMVYNDFKNHFVYNDVLYFLTPNKGSVVYSNIRMLDFSNKKISAIADCGISYGPSSFSETKVFTIEYVGDHFKITSVTAFKADPDFIKKYEVDPQFKQSMIDKYGVSSQEQFISCLGIDTNDFPAQIFGVVAIDCVDLDFDGSGEIVLLRVSSPDGSNNKQAEVIAEVYTNNNNEYTLSTSKSIIQNISYAAASNIYLYFSEKHARYCIIVDSFESGTYTGMNAGWALMYGININSIEEYISLTESPEMGANLDFNSQLSNINAPYAKYCTEVDNRNNALYYQPLCEIEHELYGDMGSYLTRNHKLLIKNTLS